MFTFSQLKRVISSIAVISAGVVPRISLAQSMAPIAPRAITSAKDDTAAAAKIFKSGTRPKRPLWLLPLLGAKADAVEEFYQVSDWITPVQQVRYLYGFGQGSKSLSADLASMIFPSGVIVALGSSVTATPTPATPAGQAADTGDSSAQALARLKAGGDFFVRASYPIIAAGSSDKSNMFTLFSVSRLAFNVSGLGDETTITESTEHNFNSSLEAYGQYGALSNQGFLYGDITSGWQNVQPQFATAVGLPHRNFMLTQMTIGLQFGDFLRLGFQRFAGPAPAFGTTKDKLSGWHLILQLIPPQKKKS